MARMVFTELPKTETVEAIEALLPGNISMDQIWAVEQGRCLLTAYEVFSHFLDRLYTYIVYSS